MTYAELAENAELNKDLALGALVVAREQYFASLKSDDQEAIEGAAENLIDLQFGFVQAFNDYMTLSISARQIA